MKLKNKVAIITGSASGIGKAIAKLFSEEGAKVVIADISNKGEKVAEKINGALFIKTDVRREESVKKLFEETVKRFGKIDILVNNAGVGKNVLLEDMSQEDWDKIIEINLRGYFFGIKHVVPYMKNHGGVIVNTASELAFVGDPGWSAYAASKGGVIQLTKVAALELMKYNIRVNVLCPGPTATPMLLEGITEEEKKRIESLVPLGRLGRSEEIAKGALFLASDDSSFMTGSHLLIDGGIVAKE
ncbi:MAG: SDR family oxidoreductase [Candidatus Aenigmarchaeota archaeon]|nr:SDR family oxidoreductase [Candidatus Aenigmarchaeota archaeon]